MSAALYQQRLARIRIAATASTVHAWDHLAAYNRDNIPAFTAIAVPAVTAAQRLAVRATTAHIFGSVPRVPIAVPTEMRKGTTLNEVYQRPFGKVWKALNDGSTLSDAISIGRAYLEALAPMDVAIAVRSTYQAIGNASDAVNGWVRVSDGGACDLCAAADGQTYNNGDDMGLHPGCGCTLEPITGRAVDTSDDSAFTIHTSDELGALLYQHGHAFTAA